MSRVNSRSDLVAPSAQQVKTQGVVISENERTLQMSLSREKKKKKLDLVTAVDRFVSPVAE